MRKLETGAPPSDVAVGTPPSGAPLPLPAVASWYKRPLPAAQMEVEAAFAVAKNALVPPTAGAAHTLSPEPSVTR